MQIDLKISVSGNTMDDINDEIASQFKFSAPEVKARDYAAISFPLTKSPVEWIKVLRSFIQDLGLKEALDAFKTLPVNHPDVARFRAYATNESGVVMSSYLNDIIDNNGYDSRFSS